MMDKEKRRSERQGQEPESTKPIGQPCISLDAMDAGSDEMNLVEFPLAGLSDRSPAGRNALVFEDVIWDRSRSANVRRRLTITGSSQYGLPTALDDEVILGLIQLSKASRFENRYVSFRPVQLIRLLGWRLEGRSYDRLEKSLRRWLGITLYYDSAWWDKRRKAWVDEHFHLIDHVVIRRSSGRDGRARSHSGRTVPWSFAWNDVVFQSFQVGYLRPLDMKLYRELKSPAAKRMYRFLDKRFYRSSHFEFDLRVFACEHIGFGRTYDNSQLKRRLRPAIAELESVGYLEPLSPTEHFHKVCRGQWKIRLVRRQSTRRRRKTRSRWQALEAALADRGVTPAVATRLVHEHSHRMIREKIVEFDRLQGAQGAIELRNPPGFLVKSIQNSGLCPVEESLKYRRLAITECERGLARETRICQQEAAEKKRQQDKERRAIAKYLSGLSPGDMEKLEAEALQHASPMLAKCYERSCQVENLRLSETYRSMILHAHVRHIMGLDTGAR